jgi:hypothetical protein
VTLSGDAHASWWLPAMPLRVRRFGPLWRLVSEGARDEEDG